MTQTTDDGYGCTAKIRPFRPVNDYEVTCERTDLHNSHRAVIRDYAYPGSATELDWRDEDRRTFRSEWAECGWTDCILPGGHHGDHAL